MPTIIGPDVDVYLTITEWPRWGVWDEFDLFARMEFIGTYTPGASTNTFNGYMLQMFESSTNHVFGWIVRADASTGISNQTDISTGFTQAVSNGDSFGLRVIGTTIQSWYKPVAGAWTMLESVTDTTYTAAGNVGFYMPGNFTNNTATNPGYYNDFGAGVTTGASFPEAPIVDTFDRADAATLGMSWQQFMDHNAFEPYHVDAASIATNRATNTRFTIAGADYYGYVWAYTAPGPTPPVTPPPVLVNSVPSCVKTSAPTATAAGDINPSGPGWTPSCAGGGAVPSASDLTLAEAWDF